MEKYFLAQHVHACKLEGVAVFLDLHANKYISVPPHCMPQLDRSVHGFMTLGSSANQGEADPADAQATIDTLLARGILTTSPVIGRPASKPSVELARAFAPGQSRRTRPAIHGSHAARFAAAFLYCRASLKFERLNAVVERIGRLHSRSRSLRKESARLDSYVTIVETFRRLRVYGYTANDACLLDSLVLTLFLHQYELAPIFVIGVRSRPFEAHAWVQIGDCAIDDKLESLSRFTPILAV